MTVIPTMENAYHGLKDFPAIFIPIGITSIAAVLEKRGWQITIIDGDAENLSFNETLNRVIQEEPDYVGSTCMTATMDITNRFYLELKRKLPKVKVIVGGPHVSALPEATLEESKDIDIVVKGEGDDTIVELMDALENKQELTAVRGIAFKKDNQVIETQNQELIRDLGRLPIPAYHLLKYNSYRSYMWNNWISGCRKPIGVIFTSRGCYGKCNFCATRVIFGQKMRFFPLKRIKDEIDLLVNKYKIKILYFQDDTFTANRRMINDICDYIIERGYNKIVEINVSARTDTAHLPTLRKMRKAGVRWIFFGVESGNQRILDKMRKNVTIRQIKDSFKKANDAGLFASGNFMIGNLDETYETTIDTINLACELKQDYASFTIAIPLPGSELYRHCIDKGIEFPSWNGFGSINSPPIPLNSSLNAEQLKSLRLLAINRFFKRPTYLLRVLRRFHTFAVIKDFTKMYFALKKERKEKRY